MLMLLLTAVSSIGVKLLRRKDRQDAMELSRVRFLTYVSESMNEMSSLKDLPVLLQEIVSLLNIELKDPLKAWTRILFMNPNDPFLYSINDPSIEVPDFKSIVTARACPAIQQAKVCHVRDSDNEPGCPIESFNFKSQICVPIVDSQNDVFGIIFSGSPMPSAFGLEDISFFQFIGKAIGLTVHRLKKMEELREAYEMDSHVMACFLKSCLDQGDTFQAVLDGFAHILELDNLTLYLWNQIEGALLPTTRIGAMTAQTEPAKIRMGEGVEGKVLETGRPYWNYDVMAPDSMDGGGNPTSLVCLPLHTIKGEPLGAIRAFSADKSRMFKQEDINRALTFASRAAIAIENTLQGEGKNNGTFFSFQVSDDKKEEAA